MSVHQDELRAPFVDENAIHEIRAELKQPFFPLVQHMSSLGWTVSLALFDGKRGWVSFEKADPWHQRSKMATRCRYGCEIKSNGDDELDAAAQRAAEICLTVYETFSPTEGRPALLPGNPDVHGHITADPFSNRPSHLERDWSFYQQRAKEDRLKMYWGAGQVLHLDYCRCQVAIPPNEQSQMLMQIAAIQPVLSGRWAWGG